MRSRVQGPVPPAKLCHPPPSPKTPDPLVPKPRPALVLTVSRGNGQTFIHVSMEEAEDVYDICFDYEDGWQELMESYQDEIARTVEELKNR